MSAALLRRSIRLCEEDSNTKGRKKHKADKKRTDLQEKGGLTKLKIKRKNTKQKGIVNVEEIRKELQSQKSCIEENLKRLQVLRSGEIDQDIAAKILKRAVKYSWESTDTQHTEEGTLFTEEDFKKFEKEYVE